jgi:signal transduction histidine kinase
MHIEPVAGGRRFLFAGFGGLLVLMMVAGGDALLVLRQVRASDAEVRDVYVRRSRALDQVRAGIYQSAIVMRDFLLASDPDIAAEQVANWTGIRERTNQALADGATALDKVEAIPYSNLEAEVSVYWKLLDFITQMREKDTRNRSAEYLSNELVRRRTAMLALVDRIDQISTRQLHAGDDALDAAFRSLRLRLIVMLGVTLGVGLLLAAFTIRRTLHLETELQKRYEEGVRARGELQDLSARLVSAQEEERRAISRELHDEVGQSLSALLMEAGNAGNAAARVPDGSVDVRRHVESIKKLAEASVNVIRNMTLLLRPSMLDDFGLVPALEWQAREVSKRTGLRVHVTAEEASGELPDQLRTCIYRVVQEALHNCARHSQARSVRVIVRQEAHKILLSVEDDGHGFDAGRVRGLGLVGMEERVTHLGGAFEVRSRPGTGTKVEVELPLEERSSQQPVASSQ